MESILQHIKQHTALDIDKYKRPGVERRIGLRMSRVGRNDIAAYQEYLKQTPDEVIPLVNTILVNVTGFFRDPFAWRFLHKQVLPRIIQSGEAIRIWSAGCSSGQEVYSLAMLLAETMGTECFCRRVTIFGTDIDDAAIKQARTGTYRAKDLVHVPLVLRNKFFQGTGEDFVFTERLRRSILFSHHDILNDPPFSHIDLLVCRNTIMYFTPEAQRRVFARFHAALKDAGYLFLGPGETVCESNNLFRTINDRCHIFQKIPKRIAGERLLIFHQGGICVRPTQASDKSASDGPASDSNRYQESVKVQAIRG